MPLRLASRLSNITQTADFPRNWESRTNDSPAAAQMADFPRNWESPTIGSPAATQTTDFPRNWESRSGSGGGELRGGGGEGGI